MDMLFKQLSSLYKIRLTDRIECCRELSSAEVLRSERFSYQIAFCGEGCFSVEVRSALKDCIRVYTVRNAVMDMPAYARTQDNGYITKEPGLMPDILVPVEQSGGMVKVAGGMSCAIWIFVDVPEATAPGTYTIEVVFHALDPRSGRPFQSFCKTLSLSVLDLVLPKPTLIYTQWIHLDCIAQAHHVPVFSEAHWALIARYIQAAADTGVNMLMLPLITPPLDTAQFTERPNVQLTNIAADENGYSFDFSKAERYVALAKRSGIRYFELPQLFSQWGAEYTPNIWCRRNGALEKIFGWHINADSERYRDFLSDFSGQICAFLRRAGIFENTFYHISDEPSLNELDRYRAAHEALAGMFDGLRHIEAVSDYAFYENGLIDIPVVSTNHIEPFLQKRPKTLWAYYCCAQHEKVSNRFLAMPSARTRILGLQLYRHGVSGFLHWGFNYYNSSCSRYTINPYQTTSGDLTYPSGDAFSVYPSPDGAWPSLRAMVFYEGLQDFALCEMIEKMLGRAAAETLIDAAANAHLAFDAYPEDPAFFEVFRERALNLLKSGTPRQPKK